MKTLLFTPAYRLEPETVEAIFAVRLQALESGMILDILLTTDNPYSQEDRGKRNVLHQFRKGRKACLDGGYDAMLVIESDMIPPPDTAVKLAALEADVGYGLYAFRSSPKKVNVSQFTGGRNPGRAITGGEGVIPCSGCGTGCVLIRRHVLEEVDFRLDTGGFPDTYFTLDVCRRGYVMKADLSVVCGHKDESGEIIWPKL